MTLCAPPPRITLRGLAAGAVKGSLNIDMLDAIFSSVRHGPECTTGAARVITIYSYVPLMSLHPLLVSSEVQTKYTLD